MHYTYEPIIDWPVHERKIVHTVFCLLFAVRVSTEIESLSTTSYHRSRCTSRINHSVYQFFSIYVDKIAISSKACIQHARTLSSACKRVHIQKFFVSFIFLCRHFSLSVNNSEQMTYFNIFSSFVFWLLGYGPSMLRSLLSLFLIVHCCVRFG